MTIKWSEELITDICDHLTTGKSLLDVEKLQGYPSADSMYRQMARDPEFAARIARAREAGQDHEADAIVQMADRADIDNWQVVKLRIWARQWRASKLAPKKYGEATLLKHADAEGEKLPAPDATEAAARIAALMTLAKHRKGADAGE